MEIEFDAQTGQFITKNETCFSCTAPELTNEQVEEIKTAIMMDQTYQHEDVSGLTFYFSYEEVHNGRKSWDLVRMTIINGELKITAKFNQDSLFDALDEIAEYYDDVDEDEEDEYPEDNSENDSEDNEEELEEMSESSDDEY